MPKTHHVFPFPQRACKHFERNLGRCHHKLVLLRELWLKDCGESVCMAVSVCAIILVEVQQVMCRDLHYAHQGGFKLELYDKGQRLLHRWSDPTYFGGNTCAVDGTIQNVTISLPKKECPGCVLRLQREVCHLQKSAPQGCWSPGPVNHMCEV